MNIKTLLSTVKHYLMGKLLYPSFYKNHFLNSSETIDFLLNSRCSVGRIGNGELNMLIGQGIPFQNYSPALVEKMQKLKSDEQFLLCIPFFVFSFPKKEDLEEWQYKWWKNEINYTKYYYKKFFRKSKIIGDTQFTRFYMDYKDKTKKRVEPYIMQLKRLWDGRDIVFIEGEFTRLGVGNDLFDNAKSRKRIVCSSKDAFNQYEAIIDYVQKNFLDKNVLFLIALGPTATVMAYDLSKLGYIAYDVGHIDIEYCWFLMGATQKVPVKGKYVNESVEGRAPFYITDKKYESEIVVRIGVYDDKQ